MVLFVTAIELAKAPGVNPKMYRSALRGAQLKWRSRYERWRVPEDSPEHHEMLHVLKRLLGK